jgi:hypothetical protein
MKKRGIIRVKFSVHWLALPVCVAALPVAACQQAAAPAPATAAVPESPAAAAEPPAAPPEAKPEGAPAPAAAASGYGECHGQRIASSGEPPRAGPVELQLSPAFLDEMSACKAEDLPPSETLAQAKEGKINAKGDCEFGDVGVTCHYHAGSEFVTSSDSAQKIGQGELHCIFPSGDAKSPHVFGGHIACRGRKPTKPEGHAKHEVKQGAACSADVLKVLPQCNAFRCCDDGTLTNPIADLVRDKRNDIRPDFRICSDTLEIDCDLLASYTPHDANSPALGGVGEAVFAAGEPGEKPAKAAGSKGVSSGKKGTEVARTK